MGWDVCRAGLRDDQIVWDSPGQARQRGWVHQVRQHLLSKSFISAGLIPIICCFFRLKVISHLCCDFNMAVHILRSTVSVGAATTSQTLVFESVSHELHVRSTSTAPMIWLPSICFPASTLDVLFLARTIFRKLHGVSLSPEPP